MMLFALSLAYIVDGAYDLNADVTTSKTPLTNIVQCTNYYWLKCDFVLRIEKKYTCTS